MAIFFHEKASNDEREPIDSNIRKVGEHQTKMFQNLDEGLDNFDSGSEDDFDLVTIKRNQRVF